MILVGQLDRPIGYEGMSVVDAEPSLLDLDFHARLMLE
jgi:hypothetical protein